MKALLRNGLTREVDIAGCVRGLRIEAVTIDYICKMAHNTRDFA